MTAFFDIDTQIDFVFPAGALYAPGAEHVIPKVAALNQLAHKRGIALISTMSGLQNHARKVRGGDQGHSRVFRARPAGAGGDHIN